MMTMHPSIFTSRTTHKAFFFRCYVHLGTSKFRMILISPSSSHRPSQWWHLSRFTVETVTFSNTLPSLGQRIFFSHMPVDIAELATDSITSLLQAFSLAVPLLQHVPYKRQAHLDKTARRPPVLIHGYTYFGLILDFIKSEKIAQMMNGPDRFRHYFSPINGYR